MHARPVPRTGAGAPGVSRAGPAPGVDLREEALDAGPDLVANGTDGLDALAGRVLRARPGPAVFAGKTPDGTRRRLGQQLSPRPAPAPEEP
ncbi:hypothetical protein [Streptomyces sp. NPDC058326]|uniref:hypothetical protein n=1 Tax=Streptomyces sp. NPDC058326 TaxID=3346447 RepID=UPI0036E2D1D0